MYAGKGSGQGAPSRLISLPLVSSSKDLVPKTQKTLGKVGWDARITGLDVNLESSV